MSDDPYAGIGTPLQDADPYAGIATPVAAKITLTVKNRKGKPVSFEAPADADDAAIQRLAAKATGEPRFMRGVVSRMEETPSIDPEKSNSALEGFIGGALKPIDNLASWASQTGVGKAIDQFGQDIGFSSTADAVAANEEMRRGNSRTGWQTIGNIAGTIPLSRLPGGLVPQGAATGAVLSDADTPMGVIEDAGIGAVGSMIGGKMLQGAGSLASGVTDKGLRALNAAGIPLTLGQIASRGKGAISRAISKGEEAITSVPILGDLVNNARDRGTQALNVAMGNRILANVGEKLKAGTEVGHDLIDAVQKKLSERYEALVPKLTATMDRDFAADLAAAKATTATLPRTKQRQLASIVNDVFSNRTQGNVISGQALKDAESRLTLLANKYRKSPDADQSILGEAIDQVRQGLRGMVARSNPAHAAELQGLNKAWAQLKPFRAASRAAGNNATGVVTPASALSAASKGGYRDRFLETAKDVLPNKTPDSGTARRGMMALGAIGGASATGSVAVNPAIAAAALPALLYTKAGQKALNTVAFGNRPALVSKAAVPLKEISRYAPQLVAGTMAGSKD
jgi:hypothetical protein